MSEPVTLKEHIERLMQEHDRRYEQRFEAIEEAYTAALAALRTATDATFTASEKAIEKAEIAQQSYNERSNEFRGQLADQARMLMPRAEVLVMFATVDEKMGDMKKEIEGLRDSRSAATGSTSQAMENRSQTHWLLGFVVTAGVALVSVIISLINLSK